MSKSFLLLTTICLACLSHSAIAATAPERIGLFRPNDGNTAIWAVSTRPDNDPSDWQDGLLVNEPSNVQFWGWFDITHAFFADINGDDIDDKVMVQPAFAIDGNLGHQVIVSYSAEDDISGTDFNAPNGDLYPNAGGDWSWLGTPSDPRSEPIFGDIDGDNIDDFGVTATGAVVAPGTGVDDSLQWGMWQSEGVPGISRNTGANFTNWSPFGTPSLGDLPLLGDIDGDGVDDRVIHRTSSNEVFIDFSNPLGGWGDSAADRSVAFGDPGDQVSLSDINGDGLDDLVLIRPNATDGLFDLFGYYTEAGGNLDTSTVDIQDQFGQLTNDPGWLSPDRILFAQLDLPATTQNPPGDFNDDGNVDAIDYAVWRESVNGGTALPNDDNLGTPIGQNHFNLWLSNYGASNSPAPLGGAAPEPSSLAMWCLTLAAGGWSRRTRR